MSVGKGYAVQRKSYDKHNYIMDYYTNGFVFFVSLGLSNKDLQKIPRERFVAMSMRAMIIFHMKLKEIIKVKEIARELEPIITAIITKETGASPIEVSYGFRNPCESEVEQAADQTR